MKYIANFVQSCDTYNRELFIPSKNSILRGSINLIVALSFVIVNTYMMVDNFKNQKAKEIKSENIISTEMVDITKLNL